MLQDGPNAGPKAPPTYRRAGKASTRDSLFPVAAAGCNSLVVAIRPGRVSNGATRRFSNSENVNYRIRISSRYNEADFQAEKCK